MVKVTSVNKSHTFPSGVVYFYYMVLFIFITWSVRGCRDKNTYSILVFYCNIIIQATRPRQHSHHCMVYDGSGQNDWTWVHTVVDVITVPKKIPLPRGASLEPRSIRADA